MMRNLSVICIGQPCVRESRYMGRGGKGPSAGVPTFTMANLPLISVCAPGRCVRCRQGSTGVMLACRNGLTHCAFPCPTPDVGTLPLLAYGTLTVRVWGRAAQWYAQAWRRDPLVYGGLIIVSVAPGTRLGPARAEAARLSGRVISAARWAGVMGAEAGVSSVKSGVSGVGEYEMVRCWLYRMSWTTDGRRVGWRHGVCLA